MGKFSITSFMNEVSQPDTDEIFSVSVHDIDENEKNFYHIDKDEVKSLAAVIELQGGIRMPLELKKSDKPGRYVVVSGHRRLLAMKMLLENKSIESPMVPARVRSYKTEEEEMRDLIWANRTQRQRTIEEMEKEVEHLKGFAKEMYEDAKRKGEFQGRFRKFFAEEILGISEAKLQRINSTQKLEPEVRQKVIEGEISKTAATLLSSHPKEKQKEIVKEAEKKEGKVNERTIKESVEKMGLKNKQKDKKKKREKQNKNIGNGTGKEEGEFENINERDIKIEALDYIKNIIRDEIDKTSNMVADVESEDVSEKRKKYFLSLLEKKMDYFKFLLGVLDQEENNLFKENECG